MFHKIIGFAFLLFLMAACSKEIVLAEPVYPGGETPPVRFSTDRPVPGTTEPGGNVTFQVAGLKLNEGKFKFYINDALAEVVTVTENSVTVKVPPTAITGNASVVLDDKTYYGPLIYINGSLAVDPNFSTAGSRSNGQTMGLIPSPNGFYLYGAFSDFNNQASTAVPIRGVINVDGNGNYSSAQYLMSRVFDGGGVRSIVPYGTDRYIVSGGFNSYFWDESNNLFDRRFENVFNIASVFTQGQLDTMIVDIINANPEDNPEGDKDTVSAFNGGVGLGDIVRTFPTNDGKYLLIGNFLVYRSVFYPSSTATSYYTDVISMPNILKLNANGSLDSSFNYNSVTRSGGQRASGNIFDAVRLPNDDVIIVGNFNTFHGVAKRFIAKIKGTTGTVDNSFTASANSDIRSISYNATTGKILLSGTFTEYNGVPVNGVVMTNPDGSIDPSFNFKEVRGGLVNFASQIDYKGLVVISGSFTHYNNQVRPGLMFLDNSGNLIPEYNRFGLFRGRLNAVYQVANNTTGYPSLFLMGSFDRFNNTDVGNFLKLNFLK